jgi:superfamily II DNA or RNA helicase
MKGINKKKLSTEAKMIRSLITFGGTEEDRETDQSILQSEGVAALWHRIQESRFAYLADEVGMGKTRQAMAVIVLQFLKNPDSRVVVLCPGVTLQEQWKKEWKSFIESCLTEIDGTLKSFCGHKDMPLTMHHRLSEFAQSLLIDEDRIHLLRYSSFSRPIGFHNKTLVSEIKQAYLDSLIPIGIKKLNADENHAFKKLSNDENLDGENESSIHKRQVLTAELNRLFSLRLSSLVRKDVTENDSVVSKGARGIDLIVCDEAQYLRHIGNNRNTNLNYSLGSHLSQWLFMSATPLHNGKHDIKSLDQYLCPHKREKNRCTEEDSKCDQIDKAFGGDDGKDVIDILDDFLVRRPRKYFDAEEKSYNKLKYRDYSRTPADARGDAFASMVTALVQKRLVESLKGGNNRFRQGECSSFESLASSAKSTYEDGDDNPQAVSEIESSGGEKVEETPDRQDLNQLNESLRSKLSDAGFIREEDVQHISLPHPKLHQVASDVANRCFANAPNNKVLIFARRLDTVDELVFQLQKNFQVEVDRRIGCWIKILSSSDRGIRGGDETLAFNSSEGFWSNEVIVEAGIDLEEEPEPERVENIGWLDKAEELAYFKAFKKGGKDKVYGKFYSFSNRLLQRNKDKANNPMPVFVPVDESSKHVLDEDWGRFVDTIFVAGGAPSWLKDENKSNEVLDLKRCIIQSFRRSDFIVDLYMLHNFNKQQGKHLIDKLIDLFEQSNNDPDFTLHSYIEHWRRRIQKWCMHFDLISSKCFERDNDKKLKIDAEFSRMGPVVGRSGRMQNKHAVNQFKMPGYPNVLVCTDVLKEGVDMHLFCDEIIHYGVAWTSGDLEQRIGRIDRVNSLYNRRIKSFKEKEGSTYPRLKVSFPFLAGTLDEYQVARVIREKQKSDLRMDLGKREEEVSDVSLNDLFDVPDKNTEQLENKEFFPSTVEFNRDNKIEQLIQDQEKDGRLRMPEPILTNVNKEFSPLGVTTSVIRSVDSLLLHIPVAEIHSQNISSEIVSNAFVISSPVKVMGEYAVIFPAELSPIDLDNLKKDIYGLPSAHVSPLEDLEGKHSLIPSRKWNTLAVTTEDHTAPYRIDGARKQTVIAEAFGGFVLLRSPIRKEEGDELAWVDAYNHKRAEFFMAYDADILWMCALVYRPQLLGDKFKTLIQLLSRRADAYQQLHYHDDLEKWDYRSKHSLKSILPENCDLETYNQLLKQRNNFKGQIRNWQKSMISNVINSVSLELDVEDDIEKDIQGNLAPYPMHARDGLFGIIMGKKNVERFRIQTYLEMDERKVQEGFPAGSPMMIWELVVSSATIGRPPLLELSEPNELPHRDMGTWREILRTDTINVYSCVDGDDRWICVYHCASLIDGNIKEFGKAWQSVAHRMRRNSKFMRESCANDLSACFK